MTTTLYRLVCIFKLDTYAGDTGCLDMLIRGFDRIDLDHTDFILKGFYVG